MKVITDGVYFLYDGDELVYIGESDNVFRRIGQHIAQNTKSFTRFEVYATKDRKRLEGFLIRALKPKYNVSYGAQPDGNCIFDDIFPSLTIQETIRKYEEYKGDPTIREIADFVGLYPDAVLSGLHKSGAPIYKIGERWRVDRNWYKQHEEEILKFI